MNQTNPENQSESHDTLQVLLYQTSPYGNLNAIVQSDGQTVYFYLHPDGANKYFHPQACWVRNLELGPYVINSDDFIAGRQVSLPRTHTHSNQLGRLPAPEHLEVVWFEEGNGAALLEFEREGAEEQSWPGGLQFLSASNRRLMKGRILAVIPPWAGQEGFRGYAAECAMDSPICWPLPKNPRLSQRIKHSAEFWSSFTNKPDPFLVLREQLLASYPHLLADPAPQATLSDPAIAQQYYDIGGDKFPPRGLIEYRLDDRIVLLTVAMSLCPQPNVELAMPDASTMRRIELGVELPPDLSEEKLGHARTELARLAGYPWRNFRWFGAGHTCQFNNVFEHTAIVQLVKESFVSLNGSSRFTTGGFPWPQFRGDPIELLWLIPKPKPENLILV
jgi:hypothetical protein